MVAIARQSCVARVDGAEHLVDHSPSRRIGCEPVKHPAAVREPFNQPAGCQQAQMAGDAGLTLLHDLAKFHHRQLFMGEQGHDAQPRRLARRAQHIDSRMEPNGHKDINISLCDSVKVRL